MTLVKITDLLTDEIGQVIKGADGKDVNFRSVICFSLNAMKQGNTDNADLKYRIGKLIDRLGRKDEVNLTADDITLINQKISDIQPPLVVLRVRDFLEPPKEEEK